jgi:hypothetical protein
MVAEPIASGEHLVEIGVSIGVALAPAGRVSLLNLLAHADHAAYRAKRSGTGAEIYDDVLDGRRGDVLDLVGARDRARPSDVTGIGAVDAPIDMTDAFVVKRSRPGTPPSDDTDRHR